MRKWVLIFFSMMMMDAVSQEDSVIIGSGIEDFDFSYSEHYMLNDLDGELKSIEKIDFGKPLNAIGVSLQGPLQVNRTYTYEGYIGYQFILPTKITVLDTVSQSLSGFSFKMSMAGQRIMYTKKVRMYLTQGLYAGRIKLIDEERKRLKNSNQGLFGGLHVGWKVWVFDIHAFAEFNWDITSSKWKKVWIAKKQDHVLPNWNQSGAQLGMSICFSPTYRSWR